VLSQTDVPPRNLGPKASARNAERINQIINIDTWRMAALSAVAELGHPDIWIGAGFLRNAIWDRLHEFEKATPLNDIDVIYFDPSNIDLTYERTLEARLRAILPAPWSVKNQARMHAHNGDTPYDSLADAMCHWLETPTAVAIRLGASGLEILAPLGLGDLMAMTVRPTPHALKSRLNAYSGRVAAKSWIAIWPKVRVFYR
jgi:uncharacterized protein